MDNRWRTSTLTRERRVGADQESQRDDLISKFT